MTDAMVTGRMSAQKKTAGTRVLKELGLTTSQAINQLFDYLIANGQMPCAQKKRKRISKKDMQEAHELIASMCRPNQFTDMTYDEMKRHKMIAKGYGDPESWGK